MPARSVLLPANARLCFPSPLPLASSRLFHSEMRPPIAMIRPPSLARALFRALDLVPAVARLAFVSLIAAAAGCHRDRVVVYDAPKDAAPPPASHARGSASMGSVPEAMPARPSLTWKSLPEGWVDKGASGMRVANFSLPSPEGSPAELAVIPLPGTGGSDLDLVNLWRGQLGLDPIPEGELSRHTEETQIGAESVRLFSIVGASPADASASGNQILVAALRKGGFTWFFKLGGPTAVVEASKASLKSFLAAVEFGEAPVSAPVLASRAPGSASPGAAPAGPALAEWEVPPAWSSVAAPQMVHRKWTAPGPGSSSADITVSVFPGETGGLVDNLNRWRGQVGLGGLSEAELQKGIQSIDVLGGAATLVDYTGSSPESGDASRVVVVIVRRDGRSWFYKLLGPPQVVEAQRSAFVRFVQSARYSKGS